MRAGKAPVKRCSCDSKPGLVVAFLKSVSFTKDFRLGFRCDTSHSRPVETVLFCNDLVANFESLEYSTFSRS